MSSAKQRRRAASFRRTAESVSPGDLIMPWDRFRDGQNWLFPAGWGFGTGWPLERTGTQGKAPAGILTEQELRLAILISRDLCDRNQLAIGFLAHEVNFVVGDGFTWKVVLRGSRTGAVSTGLADRDGDGRPDVDPDVEACQEVLDEWRHLSGWGDAAARIDPLDLDGPDLSPPADKEAEAVRRASRDGNALLRFFAGGGDTAGLPQVREVNPELVRNPPGADTREWQFGKRTHPDDPERVLEYGIADPDDLTRVEVVPAARIAHLKVNADGTQKMGVPDFFCVGEDLERVRKLLRNMGHVAAEQAAITYWTEHAPGTTGEQVRGMIELGKDYDRLRGPFPGLDTAGGVTRQPANVTDPGTRLHVNNGQRLNPGPVQSGAGALIQVEQAILRAVGLRWGCPEYFSGDASNANFASTLVSGGPFERAVKRRQKDVAAFQQGVAMRVLAFAARSGRLSPQQVSRVRVEITAPAVAIANRLEDVQRAQVLHSMGASPQTLLAEQGYDPAVEAANRKAWQEQFPEPGRGPSGGSVPGSPPPDTDGGSDPFGGLFGEGKVGCRCGDRVWEVLDRQMLAEGFTGRITDRSNRARCYQDGTPVACHQFDHGHATGRHKTLRTDTRAAARAVLADPKKATADQWAAFAEHLRGMTAKELRAVQKEYMDRHAGRLKRERIDALVAWAKGKGTDPAGGTGKGEPPAVNYDHSDPNHPVVKEMMADADHAAKVADYHRFAVGQRNAMRSLQAALKAHKDAIDAYNETRPGTKEESNAWDAIRAATKAKDAARAEFERTQEDAHDRLVRTFGASDPQKFTRWDHPGDDGRGDYSAAALPKTMTAEQRAVLDGGEKFVAALTGGGGETEVAHAIARGGRAFCSPRRGVQVVAHGTTFRTAGTLGGSAHQATKTAVHELGHAIENTKPKLKERAAAFLKYRLGDEKQQSLAKLFPGRGFEPHEAGAKDRFDRAFEDMDAHYVGKSYGSGSTEVVSMGVEKLYDDPVGFAANDPEYFHFILWALK